MDINVVKVRLVSFMRFYVVLVLSLVTQIACASPDKCVHLRNQWGDPGAWNEYSMLSLSNSLVDGEDVVKQMSELIEREKILLAKSLHNGYETDDLVAQFLEQCSNRQRPGVYTNGMQYCLAFVRRHFLRNYFQQSRRFASFHENAYNHILLQRKQKFSLSNHEIKWCERIMCLQPTVRDLEFGQILVVPDSNTSPTQAVFHLKENYEMALQLMKEIGNDRRRYFNTMPQLLYLLECFFATVKEETHTSEIAMAYASMIKRIPHACSLWVMGYLSEEFWGNALFRHFLLIIKDISGNENIEVAFPAEIGKRPDCMSVSVVVDNLLSIMKDSSINADIEVVVEFEN